MAIFSKAAKAAARVADYLPDEPREGRLTRFVENQTAKVPSMAFLNLGVASIVASAAFALMGERYKKTANFVGLWAPTFLILGLYNKLVKLQGNDRYNR